MSHTSDGASIVVEFAASLLSQSGLDVREDHALPPVTLARIENLHLKPCRFFLFSSQLSIVVAVNDGQTSCSSGSVMPQNRLSFSTVLTLCVTKRMDETQSAGETEAYAR